MKIKTQILTTADSIDRINSDLYGLSAINGRVPLVYNSSLPIQARVASLESGIPSTPELRDGYVFTPTGQHTNELYIALPDIFDDGDDPNDPYASLTANGETLFINVQNLIQVVNLSNGTMYITLFGPNGREPLSGVTQSITLAADGMFLKKI